MPSEIIYELTTCILCGGKLEHYALAFMGENLGCMNVYKCKSCGRDDYSPKQYIGEINADKAESG